MRKHSGEVERYVEIFLLWLAKVISEILSLNFHEVVFLRWIETLEVLLEKNLCRDDLNDGFSERSTVWVYFYFDPNVI